MRAIVPRVIAIRGHKWHAVSWAVVFVLVDLRSLLSFSYCMPRFDLIMK